MVKLAFKINLKLRWKFIVYVLKYLPFIMMRTNFTCPNFQNQEAHNSGHEMGFICFYGDFSFASSIRKKGSSIRKKGSSMRTLENRCYEASNAKIKC